MTKPKPKPLLANVNSSTRSSQSKPGITVTDEQKDQIGGIAAPLDVTSSLVPPVLEEEPVQDMDPRMLRHDIWRLLPDDNTIFTPDQVSDVLKLVVEGHQDDAQLLLMTYLAKWFNAPGTPCPACGAIEGHLPKCTRQSPSTTYPNVQTVEHIQLEINRMRKALLGESGPLSPIEWGQIFAAQQALVWICGQGASAYDTVRGARIPNNPMKSPEDARPYKNW